MNLRLGGHAAGLQTDQSGLATFDFTPHVNDHLKITAIDERGTSADREIRLDDSSFDDYLVRLDKAVYDGGDTLRLDVLGHGNEPVFIDLIKDHQTASTYKVPVADGHGELQIDLPAELSGAVEMCAYRFGQLGLPVSKSRAIYIRPANQLKLQLTLDQKEYRPGRSAHLQMAVTDRSGNPKPGAVSLAAVDEAVYSAAASGMPGMESTFFQLENEILKPVYAIYNWVPGEGGSNQSDQTLEQALFAHVEDK